MASRKALSRSVDIAAGNTVLLPPARNRRAVILSPDPSTQSGYTVSLGEPATATSGITVSLNSSPIVLTRELLGDAIDGQWNAFALVAPVTVGVVEIIGE